MSRPFIAFLSLAALVAVPVLRVGPRAHATASERYEDVYYLPPPHWLRVFALGHDAALCDLLWIRALIYTGDEMVNRGALVHVFDYTEAMLELDPSFESIYHWIATAGLYQPEAITRDEIVRTIELLEQGVARLPDSGRLQWDLGATYAFEAGPYASGPEERRAWLEAGAEHLMAAARLGAAPPWMALANTQLLLRVGERERAVEHLEEMYSTVEDAALRESIAARIAELRDSSYADAFVTESEDRENARIREFPYVHPDLYFILGPRPPVEVGSSLRDGFAAHVFDDELVLEEPE